METFTKIAVTLAALIVLAIFTAAYTHQAPSSLIHEEIKHNHELMMVKAAKAIERLESDPEKVDLDSTFYRNPAADWKIEALKGRDLTMINITVYNAKINYRHILSGSKAKNQPAKFTTHSVSLN